MQPDALPAKYHANMVLALPMERRAREDRSLRREQLVCPPGERKRYAFADAELPIYAGRVEVPVTLRKIAAEHVEGPLTLVVTYQACTDEACLAPQRVEVLLRLTS